MIKEFINESNLYVEIAYLENVNEELKILRNEEVLISFLPENKRIYSFFNELHSETMRTAPKREKRRVIEAVALEVLLPRSLSKEQMYTVVKEFHKTYLYELPYVAYLVKRGTAQYIRFICSERQYSSKKKEVATLFGKEVYQKKNVSGKKVFASAEDPDAVCIHKASDVRSIRYSHFSNKSRKFAGSKTEFKQKLRQLRMMLCTIFRKMNFVQQRLFFTRINGKEAKGNVYVYRNIRDFNTTLNYFEMRLNEMETNIINGYLLEYHEDLVKIRCKFQQRIKKLKFRSHPKVTLSLNYCLRRDYFIENLTTFQEEFEREIDVFCKHLACSVLG